MANLSESRKILHRMLREVHAKIPSTVIKSGVTGRKRRSMLLAIAYSKARRAGAKLRR